MIIVIGKVRVRDGALDRALSASHEHVARSRQEPGCISHSVNLDAEQNHLLVFVEEWHDQAALLRHFELPASQAFAKQLSALAVGKPSLRIFEAAPLALP